jgi:hypothetical protein
MDLRDLTVEKNKAELYYEINRVEFCLEFGWNFECFNEDPDDKRISVYLESGVQWVNGFQHPYFPNRDEMNEITTAIENIVFEDPSRYGIDDWLEIEKDFYSERININEQ